MKISVLLTGNLRSWKLCGQVLKKTLLDKYDCDVFMSVDLDNTLQCEHKNPSHETNQTDLENAISFYNPKKVYSGFGYTENLYENIENEQFSDINIGNTEITILNLPKHTFKILFEQYFYCKKAYEKLEEYINETGIIYDVVIRLRFDQFIWSDNNLIHGFKSNSTGIIYSNENILYSEMLKNLEAILIDKPYDNEIYVFGYGLYHNYAYTNDQFWIHNSSMIKHMKNFYDCLPNIIDSSKNSHPCFGASIEHFFYLYLKSKTVIKSGISGSFVRLNNSI